MPKVEMSPAEKAAFDRCANYIAEMICKYAPIVLLENKSKENGV